MIRAEQISLAEGQYLIIDPCYIKNGYDDLETIESYHYGDGTYTVLDEDEGVIGQLGVDSGVLKLYRAKCDTAVLSESGYSGYLILDESHEIENLLVEYDQPYDD